MLPAVLTVEAVLFQPQCTWMSVVLMWMLMCVDCYRRKTVLSVVRDSYRASV